MNNHPRQVWFHGTVGLGSAFVATVAVLLLLPGELNAYRTLAVWLACVSLVTFAYYGYDKFRARHEGRRVPELVLHLLAIAGGSLGAFAGMWVFRHKTIKGSFRIAFWFIVCFQLAAIALVGYGLWQHAAG